MTRNQLPPVPQLALQRYPSFYDYLIHRATEQAIAHELAARKQGRA